MERWWKIDKWNRLHSHTADAICDTFYEALLGWSHAKKQGCTHIHPPKHKKKYFKIPYKSSAISIVDGRLKLANAKGTEPVWINNWKWALPKTAEIGWNGIEYELRACYEIGEVAEKANKDNVHKAGIDLGEIHPAVAFDGENCYIVNGREYRSKRRYQNKLKGKLDAKIAKKKNGSKRKGKLVKSKKKQLTKIKNQMKDIEHKQTTSLVNVLEFNGVNHVVIGDLRDLRQNVDVGKKGNQKIHQMISGKTREYIEYKSHKKGISTEIVSEAYTTKTCPKCHELNGTSDRNYKCKKCGFEYHRDGVGSINIYGRSKKYPGNAYQVVGGMAPPIGIRYKADMRCSSLNARGKRDAISFKSQDAPVLSEGSA